MRERKRAGSGAFERTWLTIDGAFDRLGPNRPDFFEVPEELARLVIERYTEPEDIVLDPYAGFGSIVVAAQNLGRTAIAIEQELEKVRALSNRLNPPSRVIQGEFKTGAESDLPKVDLVYTSPPNTTFGGWDDEIGFVTYWAEFDRLFDRLSHVLKPSGTLVFEASNQREGSSIRPLAFEAAIRLSQNYLFSEEYVRCNTGDTYAATHSYHTHLFVFRNTRSRKRKIEDVSVGEYL